MIEINNIYSDFQDILKNLPEGIVLFNKKTSEIVLKNQEFARLFSSEVKLNHL